MDAFKAYYNELDKNAAKWLRNLAAAGEIPEGTVDDRSITEVRASDLAGFRQCHFFSGVGGWPLSLRLANWPAGRQVWTASLPCQPFSISGRGAGEADERHLWPTFKPLVAVGRPATIFGEQVASPAGRAWFSRVRADLEELGYAVGVADLCAAGIGAPHIRQRLFWVADSSRSGLSLSEREAVQRERRRQEGSPAPGGGEGHGGGMGDSERMGLSGIERGGAGQESEVRRQGSRPWDTARPCKGADGKTRRLEPGLAPLAHGVPGRVVLIRGYGNAIVPQLAAEFIKAYLETL